MTDAQPTRETSMVSPDLLVRVADLAEAAGRAAMAHYRVGIAVETKDGDSPVTAADRDAHDVIVSALASWFPDIPIISEEGDLPDAAGRRAWHRFWLVDPLDGTKEFIHHNGEFTVNIALVEEGVPVLGAVHAPALEVSYYGALGLGAWRRGRGAPPTPIRSHPPEPGRKLRVVESRSHPSPELERYLTTIPVGERVAAGSSLKFCLLAEGRADVYPRFGATREWDTAAGDAIFRYSGVHSTRRSPLRYNQPDLEHRGFVLGLDGEAPDDRGGAVVWLTGLSGSGKSTIARKVVERLAAGGAAVEYLDGDVIRDIFPATGFTREERDAHIRRVGYLASRLERHGVIVVSALVSPYRSSRDFVRGLCGRFIEVFVDTSLEECERRDVKGLYARARRGEIAHFTGIDDPYEPPARPELTLSTAELSVDEAAARVVEALRTA